MSEILNSLKQEDFEEGLSAEEKYNLAKDLTVIHNVIENHDRSLFQLIAGFNVLQKIILESNLITEDNFKIKIQEEIQNLEKIYLEKVAERSERSERSEKSE